MEGGPGWPKYIGTFKFGKMTPFDVHNNPTKGFGPIVFGLEYISGRVLDKCNFLIRGKIPFKDSFCPVQIYDPDKPIKWGPI